MDRGGGATEVHVAKTLLLMEFDNSTHVVCLTWSMAFSSSEERSYHANMIACPSSWNQVAHIVERFYGTYI
jgi:hypothetical protein